MLEDKTVNTFTQKPAATQILSYIVVVMECVVYFSCLFPHLQSLTAQITLTTLLCGFTLALIGFTLAASITDPTDPVVRDYRRSRS